MATRCPRKDKLTLYQLAKSPKNVIQPCRNAQGPFLPPHHTGCSERAQGHSSEAQIAQDSDRAMFHLHTFAVVETAWGVGSREVLCGNRLIKKLGNSYSH